MKHGGENGMCQESVSYPNGGYRLLYVGQQGGSVGNIHGEKKTIRRSWEYHEIKAIPIVWQKNRTQKDTTLIFLRSIFLPYPDFFFCVTRKFTHSVSAQHHFFALQYGTRDNVG
ncbi:MAG: hypothetical protein MUC43_16415 [Pirellula sp.]|jgi:hypothetical protein|nr:hypothetical protein [Pirellula sp.]